MKVYRLIKTEYTEDEVTRPSHGGGIYATSKGYGTLYFYPEQFTVEEVPDPEPPVGTVMASNAFPSLVFVRRSAYDDGLNPDPWWGTDGRRYTYGWLVEKYPSGFTILRNGAAG